MDILWTPWRYAYIKSGSSEQQDRQTACVFCELLKDKRTGSDDGVVRALELIAHRALRHRRKLRVRPRVVRDLMPVGDNLFHDVRKLRHALPDEEKGRVDFPLPEHLEQARRIRAVRAVVESHGHVWAIDMALRVGGFRLARGRRSRGVGGQSGGRRRCGRRRGGCRHRCGRGWGGRGRGAGESGERDENGGQETIHGGPFTSGIFPR